MKPKMTAIRMEQPSVKPTLENATQLVFWGMYQERQVRLFYFDEDQPAPTGFVEVDYMEGSIPPVSLWMKDEDL
jgi:hypothetical protein